MELSDPVQRRADTLAPFLARLSILDDVSGKPDVPEVISLDGSTLELEPWERDVLRDATVTDGSAKPWATLLAHGVAFQVKCLTQPDPGSECDLELAFREERTLDVAIGIALLQEIQGVIDHCIVGGDLGAAKKLTQFRNKLATSVSELKEQLDEEALADARDRVKDLIVPAVTEPEVSTSIGPPSGSGITEETWNRRRRPTSAVARPVAKKPTSRAKPLFLMLAGASALWLVLILPRFLQQEIPTLELEDFAQIRTVRSIAARPPSLFVSVDRSRWQELSAADRRDLVDRIGAVARQAGYRGVQVRTQDGVTVGQWLLDTGTKVIESSARGS